jgi:hypothetical protein
VNNHHSAILILPLQKTAAGVSSPRHTAQRRHHSIAGAFFVPAVPRYGGPRGETERSAGLPCDRSANPAWSVACLAVGGGSNFLTRKPS